MGKNAAKEVSSGLRAVDAVGLSRVNLEVIRQICVDQLLDKLDGVRKVHVVIPRAMYQKQMTLEIGNTVHHGIVAIHVDIRRREPEVALGINGVIILPVGHGGYSNPGAKAITVGQGVQGEGASPTPSPPSETFGVQLRIGAQGLIQRRDLVP